MAATQTEQGLASLLPTHRGIRSTAKSPAVEGKLAARRRVITSLRHLLLLGDLAVTLVLAGLGLVGGHVVASGMVLLVFLAVAAHVLSADSSRSIVSTRPVLRAATVLTGIVSVLVVLLGLRTQGTEVLLGATAAAVALIALRVALRLPTVAPHHGLGERRRLIVGDPRALESTAARRAPAVESGEVILLVTRAEHVSGTVPEESTSVEDNRRQRDDGGGPDGLVERVVRTALDNGVERVTVIPGDSWQQQQLRELSWLLEGTGIDMVISTSLDGIAPHRVDVVQQDGRLMIRVGSASPRGTHALLKGTLDRVAAATLLLLSGPVLLAIMVAVRLDSGGPAVFRQVRVREGGATFTMYKFRTMQVDAEKQLTELQELNMHGSDHPLFKMEDDPRITRVGQLLRKTSLDELPQLVNVLKGQMSLIGPRPALPLEVEMYDYVARRRLAVKPGMTGLWQVSGRSRLTWDESIGFDLDYVDNWSPITDATIAMRTFRAVITKDGAL
ncbi:MAG: exopolysaccharide biosynthesis polyprenyl glycosylphosphotransferase [Nocardioidaceae bacterium]